ncbi:hypothetical protein BDV96DRAFT_604761 [Lophiotrema nucula]|uniref:C2H2-type domain-containing protein n=1 Tax=Lophiotrema nucula TaxID=690887 RepID=A0A6A5YTL1_9PLEO|nr:hypothetical protein BDV96DRAFT_604761 [Lophiotrema nucula]
MSQPSNNSNYPPFNYNTSSAGDTSFSQWTPQASRAGNNVRRPTPSPQFRQARSVSGARPMNPMNYGQAIDPTLSNAALLTVPSMSRSRSAVDPRNTIENNANPITRFYNEDAPWSSERPRNPIASMARHSFSHPNMEYGTYRDGPGSDIDSIAPRSDSGYYTHPPHSIISNDPERCDQELPSDVTFQVGNITVASAPSEPADMYRMPSNSDQVSQYSSRSQGKEFKCQECKEVSKCKSDHKKHMLKHSKPFKCNQANCRRGDRGFTTINDLIRHKKSVHRIGATTNSYQCASETCRNKEKIWPRLDNFKQHISRMHGDEDEADLIRKSQYRPPDPASTAEQSLSVAPMDTTLIAGIGTEKQFPSNDSDDSNPGISLTPDQGTNPWNSNFELESSFAMDVDQSNFGQASKRNRHSISSGRQNASNGPARSNSSRLDTLAFAAEQADSSKASPQPRARRLSTAPQTKADQQKQALQKFSKMIVQDIQNSNNSDSVDLESIVLRVLSGAVKTDRADAQQSHLSSTTQKRPKSNEASISKTEALKASQAISSLIKRSTHKPTGTDSRPKPFSPNAKTCEQCGQTLARSCDLRKHMKRHTKPYGCTYPKCHKRFGAKSDWKRHENSQHFQLESFRCGLDATPGVNGVCAELFHRPEGFKEHLTTEHNFNVDDTEPLDEEVKKRRIGKNGQGQFYCGFCFDIITLKKKRNEAWDERFDHIDTHFSKEEKCIEDWICVEAKKSKGAVKREMDRNKFDDDDDEGEIGSPEDDSSSGDSQQGGSSVPATRSSMPKPRPASSSLHVPSGSRKRRASPELLPPRPAKRSRADFVRFCVSTTHHARF